jgi:peptidoglycan/xylan/chitin deacetylase (PgdA/CDA1 family)
MNKPMDATIRSLVNMVPFPLMKRIGSCEPIILYYHVVNDEKLPHICQLYRYKTKRQFVDDLDFLLKQYSPIGLSDVIHSVRGDSRLPENCFLMTFDDGLREIYDVIAPILSEKGIPATFFISTAFLDNRELCYQHKASLLVEKIQEGISSGTERAIKGILSKIGISFYHLAEGVLKVDYGHREALERIGDVLLFDFKGYLVEKQPYLTSGQVNGLMERGFTIGAHSIDHPYYSALTLDVQLEQTIGSVKKMREIFGLDYGAFAFPHNDTGVSMEFFKKIRASGLVDVTFGTGGMVDVGFPNHRQRVSLERPVLPAKELLSWHYARKFYKKLGFRSQ